MISKEQLIKSIQEKKELDTYETVISVIGTGGAGNNTISNLKKKNPSGIKAIAINTDAQDLSKSIADRKILIGKNITGGLGAGGDPEIGERAAEESREILNTVLEGTDLLFITCGMGGGTGTGSAPVIAQLAREKKILTIAVVTLPFSDEGIIRWENAQIGLEKLRKQVDSIIILKNDRLLELYPDYNISKAFAEGDKLLINTLMGISDLIVKKGLINLDFADINIVMRDGPNAVIGFGESSSENRVDDAISRALSHPMMKFDITGAQSALIHITGGPSLTIKEANKAIKKVKDKLDTSARIIWGITIDKNLKNKVKVMIIASGLVEEHEKEELLEREHEEELIINEEEEQIIHEAKRLLDNDRTIFDIKESILSEGSSTTSKSHEAKPLTKTTLLFYDIFNDEIKGDLKRFNRAIQFLRENPKDIKHILDAQKAVKLILASSQMFGFDEISELLTSINEILESVRSREIQFSPKILDSVTLAMEMVIDLAQTKSDGKGETGYIVNRLREMKQEAM